ncbi:MAG: hypothetical protein IT332_13950 [Ardenticatenales bacterium]|jgi:hypothetical protein|nr:hypothetical protein [Ardenticatenales bacterium]MCC7020860.1 hypothetical protein [Ardenticatenales bacterium]
MFFHSDIRAQQARFDDLRREAIGQLRIRQRQGDRVADERQRSRSLLSRLDRLSRPWR